MFGFLNNGFVIFTEKNGFEYWPMVAIFINEAIGVMLL